MANKFKILFCGKKDTFVSGIKNLTQNEDVHLLYTSSGDFLMSRAMFNPPHMVIFHADPSQSVPIDVVREFCTQFRDATLLIATTVLEHQMIVEVVKAGAKGCYILPGDSKLFNDQIQIEIEKWRSAKQRKEFTDLQRDIYDFSHIIGSSESLQAILNRARMVIQNPAINVLITGETGTGKELLARAIHYNSKNQSFPFVDIGCSALPETLLESELFGFEKGAFTDAKDKKIGLFELAGNGTIFLDEIGDISRTTQSKLLKVVESHTMRRIGGLKDIPVNARIIAATSVNLEEKIKSGEFRRDLYHRLKIVPLELPSLRNRRDDIPLLIEKFIQQFNGMYTKKIKGIDPRVLDQLMQYDWPGNIRELEHCIERAILLEENDRITSKHLDLFDDHSFQDESNKSKGKKDGRAVVFTISLSDSSIENVQNKVVEQVLSLVDGNKSKAAQILGISRPRLDRILSKI